VSISVFWHAKNGLEISVFRSQCQLAFFKDPRLPCKLAAIKKFMLVLMWGPPFCGGPCAAAQAAHA